MIYLLPVSHDVQFNSHSLSRKLKDYLIKLIKEKKIGFVCEEANEEMKRFSSIPLQASADCATNYIPCEPSKEEAHKLGILPENWQETLAQDVALELVETGTPFNTLKKMDKKMKMSNKIREDYWLNKIKAYKQSNIVFVLGVGHISSYANGVDDDYSQIVYGKGGLKLSEGFDTLLEENGFKVEILSKQFVNPKFLYKKILR